METNIIIPYKVLQLWEDQALRENIPYTEFAAFLRMKQAKYMERLQPSEQRKEIFANEAKNKLSDYGNKQALKHLLSIPQTERVCKFLKYDFEDLQELFVKVQAGKADKENFLWQLESWYKKLRSDMKEYRLSKETLKSYGLDYKKAVTFYFAAN